MNKPSRSSSERAASSEYLKEYGGLLTDVSLLVEALDKQFVPQEESETFSVERVDGPLSVPEQIIDEIGPVESATVTYEHQDSGSISVELFGETKVYYASRHADTTEFTDTVIDIKPLDTVSNFFLTAADRERLPHNTESAADFEKRIKQIPGLSDSDFSKLLVSLAHPEKNISLDDDAVQITDAFDPLLKQTLIEATRSTSLAQSGSIEYTFLADVSAELTYFYEQGQPSYFHFKCIGDNGETLQLQSKMHETIELDFPRHVIARGVHNDPVDEIRSVSLTIPEIKRIRAIITDEIASLPEENDLEEAPVSIEKIADDYTSPEDFIDTFVDTQREEKLSELNDELSWLLDYGNDTPPRGDNR